MKIHYVFYIVGVIFIFASVIYFSYEFLADLDRVLKLVLLIFSVVGAFIVAELLRGGDL